MQASHVGKHSGERNSQYGTAWICRPGEKPRKVKKADLQRWLEQGWKRGRKIQLDCPVQYEYLSRPPLRDMGATHLGR